MIFCARQLIKKLLNIIPKHFSFLWISEKAYDSVPRDVMWLILSKHGVPKKLVNLIRSFHEDM